MKIYWKGALVAIIENSELTAATKAFGGIWKEFKRDGIQVMTVPKRKPKKGVLADGVETAYEMGMFLAELQRVGYTVKEKAKAKKGGAK